MFQVRIQDLLNKKNIEIDKSREQVMEYVAQQITNKIRNNDRRGIVLKSSTGSGKSTALLYHLYQQNPHFKIVCSQVTITNTQEIAISMTQMYPELVLGNNIGYQTGSKIIQPRQPNSIIYQTIKITTNQILKPLLFKQQEQQQQLQVDNMILVIDEAHSNDMNMQEQLAMVRTICKQTSNIPFIIVQSASIVLEDFQKYLNSTFLITTLGQRNTIIELYLDDFDFRNKYKESVKDNFDNYWVEDQQDDQQSVEQFMSQEYNQIINDSDSESEIDDFKNKYPQKNKHTPRDKYPHKDKQLQKNKYQQNDKYPQKKKKQQQVNEFAQMTEKVIENILLQTPIIQRTSQQVICNIGGSILIFICKNKQMTELYQHLLKNSLIKKKNIPIIQISAVLVEKDNTLIAQTKIPGQKIIIATSVVETGFTFTDLSYVIDCLKTKYVYYNPNKKMEVQRDLPIDKNMQQQRRGRVGRTQGGIYIGICERKISEQLQENREYQIQTSDLKQVVCSIGLQNFLKMEYIGKIPIELILDVLQYQCLFGFQFVESQQSSIFNIFMTEEKIKVKPAYKFLLLWSVLQNLKICEIVMIVCFLEKFQSFQYKQKEKPQKQINDFKQILQFITKIKVQELPNGYIQLYNDIIYVLQFLQLNIYSGISILSDDTKEIEIIRKAFCDSFKQNVMIHLKKNVYTTLYGLQVVVPLSDSYKQFPKYLTTNKLTDDGTVKAQFLIECNQKDMDKIYELCKQDH